jgi:hypothetical protein
MLEKWIVTNRVQGYEFASTGSGQSLEAVFCEHGNEFSSSIKGREFLDHVNNYQLHTKKSLLPEVAIIGQLLTIHDVK